MQKDDKSLNIDIPQELNGITILSVISDLEKFLSEPYEHAVLNFTNVSFVYPGGLTPLLAYLKDKIEKNPKKHVSIYSKGSKIDKYIRKMGFYSILGLPDNYKWIKPTGKGRFQEPYYFSKFTNPEEVNKKSDNIISTFIKNRNEIYYNEAIG